MARNDLPADEANNQLRDARQLLVKWRVFWNVHVNMGVKLDQKGYCRGERGHGDCPACETDTFINALSVASQR